MSVAGPLGVSHFLMVSKGIEHVYLRVAKLSRGPTITFRVTQVSLIYIFIYDSSYTRVNFQYPIYQIILFLF